MSLRPMLCRPRGFDGGPRCFTNEVETAVLVVLCVVTVVAEMKRFMSSVDDGGGASEVGLFNGNEEGLPLP